MVISACFRQGNGFFCRNNEIAVEVFFEIFHGTLRRYSHHGAFSAEGGICEGSLIGICEAARCMASWLCAHGARFVRCRRTCGAHWRMDHRLSGGGSLSVESRMAHMAKHDADHRTRQARDAAGIFSAARHDFYRVLGCRADLDRGVLYSGFGLCPMLRRDDAPHHAARAWQDR